MDGRLLRGKLDDAGGLLLGRALMNEGRGGLTGTGQVRITGDDPLLLALENLGVDYASPAP